MSSEQAWDLVGEARRLLAGIRAQQDGRDPSIAHLPNHAMMDFHRAVATYARSHVRQVVPFMHADWNTTSFDHLMWRQRAAEIGVERLYVVPHRGLGGEKLAEQLELDQAAGLNAGVVYVSRVPEERQLGLAGLWLVDGEALVQASAGSARSSPDAETYWTISMRDEHLNQAVDLWEGLQVVSERRAPSLTSAVDLEEPLVASADLMGSVAEVLCTGDHVDPDGCGWYHGAWQYLRLMDMVSTPTWHSSFYSDALGALLTENPTANLLITGTADYSVLAYVDAVARRLGAEPRITVLDRCATPLFACRWYGKRAQREVTTVAEDLFEGTVSTSHGTWDGIVTDAFLTRFSPSESAEVVGLWEALLRPGGALITTVRIHSDSPSGRTSSEAVSDFRNRARQRAERWQAFLDRSAEEIAELAENYAARMRSTDVGDSASVLSLFERAGLSVTSSQLNEVPGELHPTTYVELVARRPDLEPTTRTPATSP